VSFYRVREDRIACAAGRDAPVQSPAPASRLAELGLNGNFVLQVGRIEARKNQAAALAAVERLDGVTLVVAGPERDAALAAKLRESPHCKVLGRVDQPTSSFSTSSSGDRRAEPVRRVRAARAGGDGRGKVVVAAKSSSYLRSAATPPFTSTTHLIRRSWQSARVALGDKQLRTSLGRAARSGAKVHVDKTAAGVADVIRELF